VLAGGWRARWLMVERGTVRLLGLFVPRNPTHLIGEGAFLRVHPLLGAFRAEGEAHTAAQATP
jgi:hypothetical protein